MDDKKHNRKGCWGCSGMTLAIVGGVIFLFSLFLINLSEDEMDKQRQLYSESAERHEKALEEYYADSTSYKKSLDFIRQQQTAFDNGDSILAAQLEDSIAVYGEPQREEAGHIGFNIAGVFFVVFAMIGFILFCIGAVLIAIGYFLKRK